MCKLSYQNYLGNIFPAAKKKESKNSYTNIQTNNQSNKQGHI